MYYTVKIKFDLIEEKSNGEQKIKKITETYLVDGDSCMDAEEKTRKSFEDKFVSHHAVVPSYEIKSVTQSNIVSIIN